MLHILLISLSRALSLYVAIISRVKTLKFEDHWVTGGGFLFKKGDLLDPVRFTSLHFRGQNFEDGGLPAKTFSHAK